MGHMLRVSGEEKEEKFQNGRPDRANPHLSLTRYLAAALSEFSGLYPRRSRIQMTALAFLRICRGCCGLGLQLRKQPVSAFLSVEKMRQGTALQHDTA